MTRDYYSDLELQPTAELVEIKRQFKKLGRVKIILQNLSQLLTTAYSSFEVAS